MISLNKITTDWTLFLDRDGVINHEDHRTYINFWEDFKFYEGVKEAFEIFSRKFKRIIIVTNQRGVGKGITNEKELHRIHENMQREIIKYNGRVDAVYYCSDIEDNGLRRKPNPGMGFEALKNFPDIDIAKAIMVGNTLSDMHFGRNLGTHTVFLPTTRLEETDLNDPAIDAVYPSLIAFAQALV